MKPGIKLGNYTVRFYSGRWCCWGFELSFMPSERAFTICLANRFWGFEIWDITRVE